METYEKLVLDVVLFEGSDVITQSDITGPRLQSTGLMDEEM